MVGPTRLRTSSSRSSQWLVPDKRAPAATGAPPSSSSASAHRPGHWAGVDDDRLTYTTPMTPAELLRRVHGCAFDDFLLSPQFSVVARRDPARIDLTSR